MIKVKTALTADPIPELEAFIASIETMVQDIANNVVEKYRATIIDELSSTPPPAKKPIEWQSEKQRKAFFATDGFGKGIPTKRTGKLQKGWMVDAIADGKAVNIVILNTNDYAKYVVGSLAQNASNASRFQQRMHKNTGWELASVTAQYWLNEMMDEFTREYNSAIGEFAQLKTKRRAFTS